MVNMKDVPSTERMVLCSKQWKMLTQKEKDMFQKRCEQVGPDPTGTDPSSSDSNTTSCLQKKKQYDVDLQRFLEVRLRPLTKPGSGLCERVTSDQNQAADGSSWQQ